MSKIYRIQPSEHVDHITEDGSELTKLPYPFFVDEEGKIGRQDFWRGEHAQVIGFQKDLAVQKIDLWWRDALEDPQQVVGMYLVTADSKGDWFSHSFAVRDIAVEREEESAS